jgi:hypothetical protein
MPHTLDGNRTVLSSSEASAMSGFTRTHINYLINQGMLEAVKVANVWLVYEDSLRRYLASPRRPGPKPRASGAPSAEPTMTHKRG